MTIIIPKYSSSKILEPTAQDYQQLGIEQPEKSGIQLASLDEIKDYVGVDLTFGISIVKKGFLRNKSSDLYASTDNDCARLGIKNNFAVGQNNEVMIKSYSIKDGVAYVADPKGTLVETFANELKMMKNVAKDGIVNLLVPLRNDLGQALGICNLVLEHPSIQETLQKHGTKMVDTLFPKYRQINATIPELKSTGTTSNGLAYGTF